MHGFSGTQVPLQYRFIRLEGRMGSQLPSLDDNWHLIARSWNRSCLRYVARRLDSDFRLNITRQ